MKKQISQNDCDLIRSYLEGNSNALKLLIEKWHVQFCKKAFWIVKDADLAKDIAQDTWQVILVKLNTLQNPDKFEFWASRIIYNKSIDALNKRNKERIEIKNVMYFNQKNEEPNSEKENLNTKLLQAIKALPIGQQQVLSLFYLESYSLNQISELLNLSVGTTKSRLFYAREKLKSILKNRNYEN